MDLSISYDIDLSPLARVAKRVQEELEDELAQLVAAGGEKLEREWIANADTLLHGTTAADYVAHIQNGVQYPFEDDKLHYVIINDYNANGFPNARSFEEGVKPFDLKKALLTSSKVRISKKDGHRYLIIPFTHSMKSIESAGIDAREVRSLAPSTFRRGDFPRGSIAHQRAKQGGSGRPHQYEWGDALTDVGDLGKRRKFFAGYNSRSGMYDETIDYTWKASPFERMYRFQLTHGSQYTTFRTMSDNSPFDSWQHPGIRGMKLAETAVKRIEPDIIGELERVAQKIIDKVEGEEPAL